MNWYKGHKKGWTEIIEAVAIWSEGSKGEIIEIYRDVKTEIAEDHQVTKEEQQAYFAQREVAVMNRQKMQRRIQWEKAKNVRRCLKLAMCSFR